MLRPMSVLRVFFSVLGCVAVVGSNSGVCAASDGQGRTSDPPRPVSYSRDIRPILSEKCFHCHGPDSAARQADLRLDELTSVRADRDGRHVIMPGQPGKSELYRRITAADPAERMPPADQPRQLSAADIDLLRRWVQQGGQYEPHWSFRPIKRRRLPDVGPVHWSRQPLDRFVLRQLEDRRLEPSPQPDRATLLRRVTLDLTGLPPTPAEVDAFLQDTSPDAYEKQVDRLLASPRYGERMATEWLDAARFADSGGYQGDILRTMWPWRDWVIDAYNRNMPFDQFTIEQLAGDLLPDATLPQRIATGFHRNHRINDEDGIILEEFRVEYVADRVETTSTVWMGLTIGCARCHDHKYDPITQAEYYQLFAYFNSVAEKGRGNGNAPPLLQVPTDSAEKLEVMVMQELDEPRPTHVLVRGAYNQPGERVGPGVPGILPPLDAGAPGDRLTLARWLFDPAHPLTARVVVNRYWQLHFGRGLVATPEDFGIQGEPPSHPRLLDWLASELIGTGWDVKRIHRLIVTSATYRQSSAGTAALYALDPDNRLLARGPRFRLSAESIRDQALASSGQLSGRIGGPSVRPYQPAGLWRELVSNSMDYDQSCGDDLYRRGLYTFVRRTVPHPDLTTLDAPNRETCTVRRPRTNTPLQALALMNGPTFVEASRLLAQRVMTERPGDASARVERAFRLLLARRPTAEERRRLVESFRFYQQRYGDDMEAANQFIHVGDSDPPGTLDVAELAAYTAVVGLMMNLDEAITRE